MIQNLPVILASRSPRRRELLSLLFDAFTAVTSDFDEESVKTKGLSPKETAVALSFGKAKAVLDALDYDALVIGGDTVVVSPEGEIFGIPKDKADAKRMLLSLSGKKHRVISAVTYLTKNRRRSFSSETAVFFYPLSEEEIDAYIQSGEPFDKAGGYGIQGKGSLLVEKIEGDYFTVVGFPVAKAKKELDSLFLEENLLFSAEK